VTEQEKRRRVLLAKEARTVEKNCLVPGDYTNGTSRYQVDKYGNLRITTWGGAWANRLMIPLLRPLNVAVGDTLRVVIKRVGGTVSTTFAVDGYLGSNLFSENSTWATGDTAQDKTVAATSKSAGQLTLNDRSREAVFTDYAVSFQIFVNGQQLIPEV
jgi:hypothetical protein